MRELLLALPDLRPWRWRLVFFAALGFVPVFWSALSWPLCLLLVLAVIWLLVRCLRTIHEQRRWVSLWIRDADALRLIDNDGRSYPVTVRFSRLLFSRIVVLGLRPVIYSSSPKSLPGYLWIDLPALPRDAARRLRAWQRFNQSQAEVA